MAYRFGTHPTHYLARAKTALAKDDREYYFYAALEIRTGIESRMKDYLQVATNISKASKKGWEIAKLAKEIESAFRTGKKISQLLFVEPGTNRILAEFYYSPVSARAQKIAQQLGDYLHSGIRKHVDSSDWWSDFKTLLENGIAELEDSTLGNLMGAPMYKYATGEFKLIIEPMTDDSKKFLNDLSCGKIVAEIHMHYLDSMPAFNALDPIRGIPSNPISPVDLQFHPFTFVAKLKLADPGDSVFAANQQEGELNLSSPVGKAYEKLLGPILAKAMRLAYPHDNFTTDDNGVFHFNASISVAGQLIDPAIRPRTSGSERLVRYFCDATYPPPPNEGSTNGLYQIAMTITITS